MSACVGALLLGLSACSEHEARPAEPTSGSRSTNPPTPPRDPGNLDEGSTGAASGFVRYYVSLLNYAALTGDVDELERRSSPDCTSCTTYIQLFNDTYAKGGYFTGGTWTLGETEVRYSSLAEPSFVTADIRIARGTQKPSAKEAETSTTPSSSTLTFELSSNGTRQVREIMRGDLG